MEISDSNPIQFWPTGEESYNEKAICGVYTECFCQPFNCNDDILVSVDSPSGGSYELRAYQDGGSILETQNFSDSGNNRYLAEINFKNDIDWQLYSISSQSEAWRSVFHHQGIYYAMGGDHIMRSGTAESWTTAFTSASSSTVYRKMAFGNGNLVAISSGGPKRVCVSTDLGFTWTEVDPGTSLSWGGIAFGNGLFVIVPTGGSAVALTSSDGFTWNTHATPAAHGWKDVIYANDIFVAVANTGTATRVMTSPDGSSWSLRSTNGIDNSWNAVTYSPDLDLFVAVASSGTGNRVMTSPDGITWTGRSSAADNQWNGVTWGDGKFIAVASSGTGNRIMTSDDGFTWSIVTSPADQSWEWVIYVEQDDKYVGISSTGTQRVMIGGFECSGQFQLKIFDVSEVGPLAGFTNREYCQLGASPTCGLSWTLGSNPSIQTNGTNVSDYLIDGFPTVKDQVYQFHYQANFGNNGQTFWLVLLDENYNEIATYSKFEDNSFSETVALTPTADGAFIAVRLDGGGVVNTFTMQSLTKVSPDEIEVAHSDCIQIRNDHECTELISYSNSVNFDGLDFESGSPSGTTFYLRVPAQFWKEQNPQEQEDHELSNGQIVTLRQRIEEKRLLELGYMPNYMHRKVQKILMMDNVSIDGKNWKRRDSYDADNINRYGLKKGQVWLTKHNSVKKNTP